MDSGILLSFLLVVIAAYLYIMRKPVRIIRTKWHTSIKTLNEYNLGEVRLSIKGTSRIPNLRIEVNDNGKIKDKYLIVNNDGSFSDDIVIFSTSKYKKDISKVYSTTLKAADGTKLYETKIDSPALSFSDMN